MLNLSVQPQNRSIGNPRAKHYMSGFKKSREKLTELRFDPIEHLVSMYRHIESEVRYQEKMRSGELVELTSTGNRRAYRAEIHQTLFDKLIKIGESLLRYGYGRIPETMVIEENKSQPMIINLTAKGETYMINNDEQP